MKIFLSYPRKDTERSKKLKEVLFKGGHTVWMDDQLIVGRAWRDQLTEQIKGCDAIALALTPNWVASPYCNWEFITAIENDKDIIPVLLTSGTQLPERINQFQYADFSGDFDDARTRKFLDDLMTFSQKVNATAVQDIDKKQYAEQIDAQIAVSGSGNITGTNNTVNRMGNISIGGSVSSGNVNIGGSQNFHGETTIKFSETYLHDDGSPIERLRALLNDLEDALQHVPAGNEEDIELIKEYASELAQEVAKDKPRKRRLELTGESLKRAAENLADVTPIVVKIIQTVIQIA